MAQVIRSLTECGGCGRFYPTVFPECPFCYCEPFLASEQEPCPKCGYDETVVECPVCRTPRGSNNYCIQCGHIYYKAGGY